MAQIPMALPLFSEVNLIAMIAGATTEIRLIPAPSINRLVSRMSMPLLRAPMPEPRMREESAIKPVFLYPNFWRMKPAGKARKRPVMANRDMRRPARPAD
jgi:hypothetical protein